MRKGGLFRRFADCAIAPALRPIACSSRSGTRPALRAFAAVPLPARRECFLQIRSACRDSLPLALERERPPLKRRAQHSSLPLALERERPPVKRRLPLSRLPHLDLRR